MDKIERTWNRKLEEPEDNNSNSSAQKEDPVSDDENDGQIDIQKLLDKIASKRTPAQERGNVNPMARSQSEVFQRDEVSAEMKEDLKNTLGAQGGKTKDDSDLPTENKEFMNNNYWRVEDNQFDLDDLLKEADL